MLELILIAFLVMFSIVLIHALYKFSKYDTDITYDGMYSYDDAFGYKEEPDFKEKNK